MKRGSLLLALSRRVLGLPEARITPTQALEIAKGVCGEPEIGEKYKVHEGLKEYFIKSVRKRYFSAFFLRIDVTTGDVIQVHVFPR